MNFLAIFLEPYKNEILIMLLGKIFLVPGIEPRTLCLPGKGCATEVYSQPLSNIMYDFKRLPTSARENRKCLMRGCTLSFLKCSDSCNLGMTCMDIGSSAIKFLREIMTPTEHGVSKSQSRHTVLAH